jgi:hypothetical protein
MSYFKQITSDIGGRCKVAASRRRHKRDVHRERKKLEHEENDEETKSFDKCD